MSLSACGTAINDAINRNDSIQSFPDCEPERYYLFTVGPWAQNAGVVTQMFDGGAASISSATIQLHRGAEAIR